MASTRNAMSDRHFDSLVPHSTATAREASTGELRVAWDKQNVGERL